MPPLMFPTFSKVAPRLEDFFAPVGVSPFSLYVDLSKWDWSSLFSPNDFVWKAGITPMTSLQVILISWVLYFSTIIGIQIYMKNRQPFKLKTITAYHNLGLCLASLAMFIFTAIDTIERYQNHGMGEVFCTTNPKSLKGRLWYTMYIYYLSKFWELFDTVILVLKKKPVIFLHGYHHSIVILLVWVWLEYGIAFASLGMAFNTLIHVFMYYYYYLSSLGQTVWFKKYITSGQIVQFSTSFLLSIPYLYYQKRKGCSGWDAFVFAMGVNGTFLLLFIRFYVQTYTAAAAAKKKTVFGKVLGKKDK
ncbi:GNS1/SUR4 family-domain-containing protein [Cladochytrium replicatum]|nr:GNS1/SUR4 family-domain-containing protein [Cladochytrium replicatum]